MTRSRALTQVTEPGVGRPSVENEANGSEIPRWVAAGFRAGVARQPVGLLYRYRRTRLGRIAYLRPACSCARVSVFRVFGNSYHNAGLRLLRLYLSLGERRLNRQHRPEARPSSLDRSVQNIPDRFPLAARGQHVET
jgi:hypothetical protein